MIDRTDEGEEEQRQTHHKRHDIPTARLIVALSAEERTTKKKRRRQSMVKASNRLENSGLIYSGPSFSARATSSAWIQPNLSKHSWFLLFHYLGIPLSPSLFMQLATIGEYFFR